MAGWETKFSGLSIRISVLLIKFILHIANNNLRVFSCVQNTKLHGVYCIALSMKLTTNLYYRIAGNFRKVKFSKNLRKSDFKKIFFENPPTLPAEYLCSYRNSKKYFRK